MYKKPILQAAMEETGWKEYKEDYLPESALKVFEDNNIFRFVEGWYKAYYHGDVNTTSKWVVVTPDGGYYKHDAIYMVWSYTGESLARWSSKILEETLICIFHGKNTPCDPDYQT